MLIDREETKILKENIGHVGIVLEAGIIRSDNLIIHRRNVAADDSWRDIATGVQFGDEGRSVDFFVLFLR